MTIAIVDADGKILGTLPKPSPFLNIPAGGRMLQVVDPQIDSDLQDAELPAVVPASAQDVRYTVTNKPAYIVKAVLIRRMSGAIQKHLDTKAQEYSYDGILSASSYAGSKHAKFGREGRAFADWRDACWDYGYKVLADVEAGTRPMPTAEVLVNELPTFTIPS